MNYIKMITLFEMFILFLPMLMAVLIQKQCYIGNQAGKNVSFRPEPKVFMIVWTFLYLLIGYSWISVRRLKNYNSNITDVLYILLNISLCSWIYFYGCKNDKIKAFYTLPISMLVTMIIIMYKSSYTLLPLLVWLLFASYLNFAEIL